MLTQGQHRERGRVGFDTVSLAQVEVVCRGYPSPILRMVPLPISDGEELRQSAINRPVPPVTGACSTCFNRPVIALFSPVFTCFHLLFRVTVNFARKSRRRLAARRRGRQRFVGHSRFKEPLGYRTYNEL